MGHDYLTNTDYNYYRVHSHGTDKCCFGNLLFLLHLLILTGLLGARQQLKFFIFIILLTSHNTPRRCSYIIIIPIFQLR